VPSPPKDEFIVILRMSSISLSLISFVRNMSSIGNGANMRVVGTASKTDLATLGLESLNKIIITYRISI